MKNKLVYFILFLSVFISGCATPRTVVKKSDVSFQKYKKIYLLALDQKNDPRKVFPRVLSRLESFGLVVKVIKEGEPIVGNQGSGFLISHEGYVLTGAHILGKENTASLWINSKRYEADLIAKDDKKDLALLKIKNKQGNAFVPLQFANDTNFEMGQEVYTIGFPLSSILGNAPRLNKGLISSTVGLKDNPDELQVSVEIQPGNSGGPLLNENGKVIGIMYKTLNPMRVLQETGSDLPQNVNFALKSNVIKEFLEKNKLLVSDFSKEQIAESLSFEQVKNSVVRIHSGIVTTEELEQPKLICTFAYATMWDMWFRFPLFNIDLYDFESGDLLLRVGQYRDNPFSTENSVLDRAFEEIKEKLSLGSRSISGYQSESFSEQRQISSSEIVITRQIEKEIISTSQEYSELLYNSISKSIIKPLESGVGTINAEITLLVDGTLQDVRILDGSVESMALRKAVVRAIKKVAPFPPFPDEMKQESTKTFTITIEFK